MNKLIVILLVVFAVYTRIVGVSWGLPYPMHPDERNMADAVGRLHCDFSNLQNFEVKNCLNPEFFAYGQLPLYIAYFLIQSSSVLFHGQWATTISFESATIALRLISVIASLMTIYVVYRLLKDFFSDFFDTNSLLLILFIFIFSPYAIQFAHFGTTESLLMLLYTVILYFSLTLIITNKITLRAITVIGVVVGLSIGIKISSATFLILPSSAILWTVLKSKEKLYRKLIHVTVVFITLATVCMAFVIVSSPHMIVSLTDFLSSMNYESGVATGAIQVFYTRQFLFSIPILYQFTKILPVALGYAMFVLFGIGLFLLPINDKRINILRLALLVYLIPSSILFVKWTRFVSPILPLASIFGALVLAKIIQLAPLNSKKVVLTCLLVVCSVPGIAYLSIYQNNDVRFQASSWIHENISSSAHVFSEAGNVINIPIQSPSYDKEITSIDVLNFDFYSVDSNKELQDVLVAAMKQSDYILVPSRRIFGSVTCQLTSTTTGYEKDRCEKLRQLYPVTNEYYDKLVSGELGFTLYKTFTSYPKIEILGKSILEIPDEQFDETWSVFDHPVIRVYKRI